MEDLVFEDIYNKTARPLWAYLTRLSGSPTLADDLLQETYLNFMRSPFASGDLTGYRPYLYKIATNLVYRRTGTAKLETGAEQEVSAGEDVQGALEMHEIFSKLTARERSLLWLAHVEEYEHREIATILAIRPLSVKVLLHRARQKLAGLIETSEVKEYE